MVPDMVLARDITPTVLQYVHWPYIPQRRVSLVIGNPGVGKGLWTVDLSRAVSTGGLLPDQQGHLTMQAPQGDVIFLSAEDGYEDGLRPRLDAAKVDIDRVHILRGKKNAQEETFPITFDDIAIIEQSVRKATTPKLVVIDPVTAYMGKRDINKSGDVAPIMDALRTLATTYTLAVVLVAHSSKTTMSNRTIHRALGSMALIGGVRAAMMIEEHPKDKQQSLLSQYKGSGGIMGRTLLFRKRPPTMAIPPVSNGAGYPGNAHHAEWCPLGTRQCHVPGSRPVARRAAAREPPPGGQRPRNTGRRRRRGL